MGSYYRHWLSVCITLFIVEAASAQTNWDQIIKTSSASRLQGTTRSSSARFGNSVAVDGEYAIVGAQADQDDTLGTNILTNSGSAFIFKNISGVWTQVKKLVASDRIAWGQFAISVAISGNTVIVGSSSNEAAYIFSKDQGGVDNWGLVKRIVPSDGGLQFGFSVAISGNSLAVASLGNRSAYIFNKDQGGINNWGEVKKIVPSVGNGGFGSSVAMSGNFLVVGDRTSAFVFSKDQGGIDNWGEIKKIMGNDTDFGSVFGFSVSISGNIIVVGDYIEAEDATGLNTFNRAGAAYIFSKDQGGVNNWGQVKKIVASDRASFDHFGYSVSVSGGIIVVGAYQEDEDAAGANTLTVSGSAYIFSKDQGGVNNWGQIRKVVASNRIGFEEFGNAVAVSGNSILVGAWVESGLGSVYSFSKDQGGMNNWGQQQQINMNDFTPNQLYGYSVAIDGDFAVIGAPRDPSNSIGQVSVNNSGAAYILKNENGIWKEIKKIVASDRASSDYFGYSVCISGNLVVVSAPAEDENAGGINPLSSAGSVYIFSKDQGGVNNWGQVRKIVPLDRAEGDNFGFAVSISGNLVAVSAPAEDENATGINTLSNAGSVYIFSKDQGGVNNWGQVRKIVPLDRAAGDIFGYAVSISGNTVVVGAPLEDENATGVNTTTNAGSIYIFSKDQGGADTWGQVRKIVTSDRAPNDMFGNSVSISGSTVVAGAFSEDNDEFWWGLNSLTDAGAAYIFSKDQGGVDSWGEIKKLVDPFRARYTLFGNSVAINGNTIVIGAVALQSGGNAGVGHIFSKDQGGVDSWGRVQTIQSSDRISNDEFAGNTYFLTFQGASTLRGATSLAISGNTILVGAPTEDEDAIDQYNLDASGSAYFFRNCSSLSLATTNTISISESSSSTKAIYDGNCNLIASVQMSCCQHLVSKVWIQSTPPPTYVKRHYEITPSRFPSNYMGRITLYFTQGEFNDFNNQPDNVEKLPTNPSDIGGKANLIVEKRAGTSSNGTGLPLSYSGAITNIDPADEDIVWNAALNRWEVSFNTDGFSGFFIKTTSFVLPFSWLSLSGELNNRKQATLRWKVQENNVVSYEVEVSINKTDFSTAGILQSLGNGEHVYDFIYQPEIKRATYFRIKQKDINGKISYSGIVRVANHTLISIYPKPTKNDVLISVSSNLQNTNAKLIDLQGRLIRNIRLHNLNTQLYLNDLLPGIYLLNFENGYTEKIIKQ